MSDEKNPTGDRKKEKEISVMQRLTEPGTEELWGDDNAMKEWDLLKKWQVESEAFRAYCRIHMTDAEFDLVYGERTPSQDSANWYDVYLKRNALFESFNRLIGGDKE